MKYSKEALASVASDLILDDTISGNPNYQWVDIVGITQRPHYLRSSLFFATHSDGTDGWHIPFDRRPYTQQVASDRGWHVVGEEKDLQVPQRLLVTSTTEFARRLYDHSRMHSNPYVIGVTGSVGKTTTVAFLEHLLRSADFNVVRFWSKRLTPLIVQCHYINRVDPDTTFVILEYSAYLRNHVHDLAELLRPNLAFLMNIYAEHLGVSLFENREDIYNSKIQIRQGTALGFANQSIFSDLGVPLSPGWNTFSVDSKLIFRNDHLPPTVRTAEMQSVGLKLVELLNLPLSVFRTAFSTFRPQERRIELVGLSNGNVFMDGEASSGCRLWSWFETLDGSKPSLFIESVDFGNDVDHVSDIFGSDETFVLDTPANRINALPDAHFVDDRKFGRLLGNRIDKGMYVVFHKQLASRQDTWNAKDYLMTRWLNGN